jgi:catechol-2,3-dioxygenase
MDKPAISFSHFGIHVTDLERMVDFYTRVVGLLVMDRGRLKDGPALEDLKALHARTREDGVKQFRIVTHGNAWSVYFADPEGNRVEFFVATPWHTPQPFAEPFDIEAPVEKILADTEAICRNRPGFSSRAEWREKQVARIGA